MVTDVSNYFGDSKTPLELGRKVLKSIIIMDSWFLRTQLDQL